MQQRRSSFISPSAVEEVVEQHEAALGRRLWDGENSAAAPGIRDRISAAPPRCSPDTRLGKKPRGCVEGEQRGSATEILTQTGAEHGKRTELRIRRLSRKCRKPYGSKYAYLYCIFICVTLADGK